MYQNEDEIEDQGQRFGFVLEILGDERTNHLMQVNTYRLSHSISMVGDGKFFEKGFISELKFLNESTPSGQKILPKVPL